MPHTSGAAMWISASPRSWQEYFPCWDSTPPSVTGFWTSWQRDRRWYSSAAEHQAPTNTLCTVHSPLFISGSTVEMIRSTKFLGVNIADDLTWSLNTNSTKKAQQRQHFQWRLKRVYHHPSPPPSTEGLWRASWLHHCVFWECKASEHKPCKLELELGFAWPLLVSPLLNIWMSTTRALF